MRTFDLPSSPIAAAILATSRDNQDASLFNHSMRSYWHARSYAESAGLLDQAPEILIFAATLLHELGASALAPGRERFEIEGADIAAETLLGLGVGESDIEQVWDAIALHTSGGLAERRGALPRVVRVGIVADFGRAEEPQRELQDAVHAEWPRLNLETVLVDNIIERVKDPAAAPRFGMAGVVIHEREVHGITGMEVAARDLGW
ncbi:HD domain-containing protein [Aeromicrobium ginsengisoli]|uniref:HD domain-containing protein n=1 Tax=Aeromicrobium ginsengisoli TaxID=363867 RepID=A0A5M4FJM7_9ACTN|nr:HD domain-containing protein [Aeromicrobium ginsengisoli]KAA1400300.1 HD domain-containing protein [Aeromicrobium ginsengisoli]